MLDAEVSLGSAAARNAMHSPTNAAADNGDVEEDDTVDNVMDCHPISGTDTHCYHTVCVQCASI